MRKANQSAKAAHKKTEPMESMASNTNNVVAPVEVNSIPSVTVVNPPLTSAETELLAKCEKIIGRGLNAFKEVADALLDVRDQHLYRINYPTFEEYCRQKWGITARHAHRLMLAGAVVANIKSDQL